MRLGTGLDFSAHLGKSDFEIFTAMKDAGFSSVDYSLMQPYSAPIWKLSDGELKEKMTFIREIVQNCGLVIGQTHAPDDAYYGKAPETKEERWKAQVQAIKATSFLGAPYIVIHPIIYTYRVDKQTYAEAKKLNMEFFNHLKPYLETYNVKAAIENLFSYNPILNRHCKTTCSTAEDLMDYVDTLDSECFGVCLDTGHANLCGLDIPEMIRTLGKQYLCATHIHDNYFNIDAHMFPGMGNIDWSNIMRAFCDIKYDGVFNFEAGRPYFRLGEWRKDLAIPMLQVCAELGKMMIGEDRKEEDK